MTKGFQSESRLDSVRPSLGGRATSSPRDSRFTELDRMIAQENAEATKWRRHQQPTAEEEAWVRISASLDRWNAEHRRTK